MNFLATLNDAQLKAVIHEGGPLFVVAGAGTGKTKTLTTRIAYLIMKGIEPKRILAVTFTNKAAREMKTRVMDMVGPHAIDVWLYTFHAFGLKILRKYISELPYGYGIQFNVIDEEDAKKIIQEAIKALELDSKMYSAKAMKNLISYYKTKRIDAFEKKDEERIYLKYRDFLFENQLVDFDDLIVYPLELLSQYSAIRTYYQQQFRHVLVDEFQDTDLLQYQLLKLLALPHHTAFVVGDPDQSIYSFRGANYHNQELFQKEFKAERVVLDQNYRSTNHILKAANQLISYNFNRPTAKNLASDLGLGELPKYHRLFNDIQESFFVVNEIERLIQTRYHYQDIAILYRNNALSRLFEEALIKQGIPYRIYGGISFYERKEIKDALAYLRVVLNPDQDYYLKRIVNVPKRSIGQVSVQKLEQHAKAMGISMFEAIEYVDLTPMAKKSLQEFKQLIKDMNEHVSSMEELSQIMPYLMAKTGYIDVLKKEEDELAEDRISNLKELQNVFVRGDQYYEGTFLEKLNEQLEQIALFTDLDQELQDDNRVILSTYHQVKGLEFKVVFMVVMEEGIFPAERAFMSPQELEEERRVAYVGITRCQEKLYLSYADQRMVYGQLRYGYPSRFIKESKVEMEKAFITEKTEQETLLKTGDKVEHNTFGMGVVISVDQEVATIAFSMPHGIKKILESHPSIRKVRK